MAAVALKISGPEGERRVSVSGSVKVGRGSGCDVVLKHPAIAGEALLVRRDGGGAIADPLGGVIALNDARMQSKHQLQDGDEIKLGPYRIVVSMTGSLSIRPPSVRPGNLTPPSSRAPGTLPPGSMPPPMKASAPPPDSAPAKLSEAARVSAYADARGRLERGEKRSIVLSKLGEAGLSRGEAAAHIEDTISQLRAGTRRRARRRFLLGVLGLLSGALLSIYFSKFIPGGIGPRVADLRLPHTDHIVLVAGEHWLGPVIVVLGLVIMLAGLFRMLRGDPRFKE